MRPYNEKISLFHGMASTMAVNLSNNYFPIFAIAILGATNYQVGLISSLPPLIALIMTVPAAILLNRAAEQKKLVAMSVLIARFMYLLIIAIVYFLASPANAWVFLAVIALMSVPNTISNIGWQTLISGMIEDDRRGSFFSDRNRLLTLIGMVTTFIIGFVMKDATYNETAYQVLFFLAFCFGLLEVFLLMKHQEEDVAIEDDLLKKSLMDWSIFKDKGYKWFLIAALSFNFAWQMSWGIFSIYHVRVAGATIFWISMFSVGNMIIQIWTFPMWKKWAEQKSNVLMLVWAAIGMSFIPFLTVLSTNLYYLTLVQTISGFFVSGVTLLLFNLLLEQSPEKTRTYCITTYNVLLALVAFISPQVGIWLLNVLGVKVAMEVNSVLRFISAFSFLLMYTRYSRNKESMIV